TCFFSILLPPPPQSTLFPYTTLFRSSQGEFLIIKLHPARALLGDTAARSKILEFPVEVCHADQAILLPHSGQNLVLPSTLVPQRSEEHTSELQSLRHLVCRLLLEKKK